jgi:hypothetical protein
MATADKVLLVGAVVPATVGLGALGLATAQRRSNPGDPSRQ